MSGLVGLWNLDGRPVDRALVTSMASAIAHRGTDQSGIWCENAVGLACQLLRVTPESAGESQPLTDHLGHVLLFDGRLDNREELLAAMTAVNANSASPDSELVLAAWRQWGDASLAKLHGDFALALFDSRLQTLVLARDPVGCRPLYYWTNGRSLVFASEIKAILAHPDTRAEPDEDLLADYLVLERLPFEDDGETFFRGIHAVLPGHRLVATASNTTSARFLDFDPRVQVRYRSYDEYVEHLRALLVQAVKRRLRSTRPIAIATSGGLDSSVVLCIADDLRKNGASGAHLLPVTYTSADDPTTEENRFLRLLESERGLRVHRVAVGTAGNIEQLQSLAWHSEVPFGDGWCMEVPLLAYARAQGAGALMTGLWSDQLFFVMGYLVDLFVKLSWREIGRHLGEYTNWFVDADPGDFRARFRQELLLNLSPRQLRSWLRPFRTAVTKSRKEWLIRPELAARVRRRRPLVEHPKYATAHARNIYQIVHAKSHRLLFEVDEKMASRYGIERLTPFLDRDLIAYLMSIPGEVQNHGGIPRALLRDAMRGIVPEPILGRRWRNEAAAAPAPEDAQQAAYLSTGTRLSACKALGFCQDERLVDANCLEFVGLEFWSRAFF